MGTCTVSSNPMRPLIKFFPNPGIPVGKLPVLRVDFSRSLIFNLNVFTAFILLLSCQLYTFASAVLFVSCDIFRQQSYPLSAYICLG